MCVVWLLMGNDFGGTRHAAKKERRLLVSVAEQMRKGRQGRGKAFMARFVKIVVPSTIY